MSIEIKELSDGKFAAFLYIGESNLGQRIDKSYKSVNSAKQSVRRFLSQTPVEVVG